MDARTRKIAIGIAVGFLALVIAGSGIFLVFWPTMAFSRDAAWVGEIFWIVLLATIISSAVLAAKKKISEVNDTPHSASDEIDRRAFERKVKQCLSDRSLAGYFKRNLVEEDDIVKALTEGEAFSQARDIEWYSNYAYTRSTVQEAADVISVGMDGIFNPWVVAVLICAPVLIILLFIQIGQSTFETSGLTFGAALFAGSSAWIFGTAENGHHQRRRKSALAGIFICVSLCVIVVPPVAFGTKWISSIIMFPVCFFSVIVFFALGSDRTLEQCITLVAVGAEQVAIIFLKHDAVQAESEWLKNCEDIIKEQANLRINFILGKDKDLLLVEQDSEGLRRLQDQSYTVFTRSERRIASVLSQMDAGSIALAGPRGAGKSTLLRKFSGQQRSRSNDPGLYLYLPAPAEYIPRDFIAAFLQQLCENYLNYVRWALPGPIYKESPNLRSKVSISGFFKFLWLLTRTIVYIAIILWIIRSLVGTHYNHMYETTLAAFKGWVGSIRQIFDKEVYKRIRPDWSWIRIVVLVFVALFLLSILPRWVRYVKPHREPGACQ